MSNFYDLETDLEVEDVSSDEEYEKDYEEEEALFEGIAADYMRHQFIVTLEDNALVIRKLCLGSSKGCGVDIA